MFIFEALNKEVSVHSQYSQLSLHSQCNLCSARDIKPTVRRNALETIESPINYCLPPPRLPSSAFSVSQSVML